MNLFSTFDPASSLLNMSWIMVMIVPSLFLSKIWKQNTTFSISLMKMINTLKKEIFFNLNTQNKKQEGTILSMFTVILLMNFSALYPQSFSLTSHLTITLPLSLIIWLSVILFGWMKNTNHMLTHLLPQGTPSILMLFMVLIELTSNFIRPITLCVRLTANLIAGHLLMTLLGKAFMTISYNKVLISLVSPMLLTILESAVSIIQAYVFMTLITLYISETK